MSTPTPPTTLENLQLNTLADGAFHALAWVLTVTGLFVLVSSDGARHADGGTRAFVGAMLVGWGSFNLVEGFMDHHLLGLHHVRPGPDELLYDIGFLFWGAVMCAIGLAVIRGARAGASRPAS